MRRFFLVMCALFFLSACGDELDEPLFDASVPTQTSPVITRIAPTTASSGDAVEIFGFGFSTAAPANVITVGATSTSAAAYALVDPPIAGEIERLTFTVPSNVASGAGTIMVIVGEHFSNSDMTLTVSE